jgi:hypothetical protein
MVRDANTLLGAAVVGSEREGPGLAYVPVECLSELVIDSVWLRLFNFIGFMLLLDSRRFGLMCMNVSKFILQLEA